MVSDYISREAANEACREAVRRYPNSFYNGIEAARDAIRKLSAADVREVVTCGKCKFGKYTGTEWFCDKHSGNADKLGEDANYHEYHSKYWFCADGERRKHGEV